MQLKNECWEEGSSRGFGVLETGERNLQIILANFRANKIDFIFIPLDLVHFLSFILEII